MFSRVFAGFCNKPSGRKSCFLRMARIRKTCFCEDFVFSFGFRAFCPKFCALRKRKPLCFKRANTCFRVFLSGFAVNRPAENHVLCEWPESGKLVFVRTPEAPCTPLGRTMYAVRAYIRPLRLCTPSGRTCTSSGRTYPYYGLLGYF